MGKDRVIHQGRSPMYICRKCFSKSYSSRKTQGLQVQLYRHLNTMTIRAYWTIVRKLTTKIDMEVGATTVKAPPPPTHLFEPPRAEWGETDLIPGYSYACSLQYPYRVLINKKKVDLQITSSIVKLRELPKTKRLVQRVQEKESVPKSRTLPVWPSRDATGISWPSFSTTVPSSKPTATLTRMVDKQDAYDRHQQIRPWETKEGGYVQLGTGR